jgi:anti-sigma regulatory factor (Ser/Thr protein kinase)
MAALLQTVLDKRVEALCAFAPEAEDFLARSGVSGEAAFKVLLALEEAVRNLIEHARPSLTDQVEVRLEVRPRQVSLVLEDDGPGFDPGAPSRFDPGMSLEERVPHGMGVFLLQQFMDEIHYQRREARNRLELVVTR